MAVPQNLRITETEYRGYKAIKCFPSDGVWPRGGSHKNEIRAAVEERGFRLDSADPYLLNADEFFPDLKPLQSIVSFVFFLAD